MTFELDLPSLWLARLLTSPLCAGARSAVLLCRNVFGSVRDASHGPLAGLLLRDVRVGGVARRNRRLRCETCSYARALLAVVVPLTFLK